MRLGGADPKKGYLGNLLWLPKSAVSVPLIKKSLVVEVAGQKQKLWVEADDHIGVPRRYYQDDELPDIEIIDNRPKSYASARMKSLITLRPLQAEAYRAIGGQDGIVHLRCGFGKTVLLLHLAAERGYPTLVINDKINILDQWKLEALGDPKVDQPPKLEIDPAEVGRIQGPPKKWTWKRSLVMASLRTIYTHEEAITREMREWFGTIIYDEIQHIAAPLYLHSAHMFPGRRLGATATAHRSDGGEVAYMGHIGPILHENLEPELEPKCMVIPSPTRLNFDDRETFEAVTDIRGELHHKKLAAHVGTREDELDFVSNVIDQALAKGRKILGITASKDHVDALHARYPGSCALHGDIKAADRLERFRTAQLAFGTTDMAAEALDKKDLNMLIILTEFSKEGWLQQSVGRTQRKCEGKPVPLVVLIHHTRIPMMRRQGGKIIDTLTKWGFEIRTIKL